LKIRQDRRLISNTLLIKKEIKRIVKVITQAEEIETEEEMTKEVLPNLKAILCTSKSHKLLTMHKKNMAKKDLLLP
jgi:hypothetical protein